MTAASKGRLARRAQRRHDAEQSPIARACAELAALAARDSTISAATIFLPDGSNRFVSAADARAMFDPAWRGEHRHA